MAKRSSTATLAGPGHNSIDRDRLRALVERIENLEEEKAELTSDIRDVYAPSWSCMATGPSW
jgi:uncharacterized protein (UPF0335 family)